MCLVLRIFGSVTFVSFIVLEQIFVDMVITILISEASLLDSYL
jgi:hypothetical protein